MKIQFLVLITLCFSLQITQAQNIPVGSVDMADQRARNEQLLGKVDSLVSFTLRPLSRKLLDTTIVEKNTSYSKKIVIQALPITFIGQYTTFSPNAINDEALIPAAGYQSLINGGVYAQYGALSLQLRPEYVFAVNPDFQILSSSETDAVKLSNISYLNHSDLPTPYGNKSYSNLNWGQSNISLEINKFSIGISTENLWWGPGTRNSLIMSNTAPGFLHITANTRQPIKTFLGSFEAQIISGKLEGSGLTSPKSQFVVDGIDYEIPKKNDWRYINGLSINYHPKWVPGLFVGLNRIIQVYSSELGKGFSDYLPIFSPFQKHNLREEDAKNRDQVASLFFRWLLKDSKFEFYAENGWNDHSQDIPDLYQSPEHSRAYLIGFTKIYVLNKLKNNYFKVNFETTHLEQSADRLVRPAGAWYEHGLILHGYTNKGEVVGAGIGPGSNMQTLDLSIWSKDQILGIQVERYAHNMDFYYDAYTNYDRKWVDFAFNTYAYKKYGNFGVKAKINTSIMANYQYDYKDKINVQFQLSLQYHL